LSCALPLSSLEFAGIVAGKRIQNVANKIMQITRNIFFVHASGANWSPDISQKNRKNSYHKIKL
jgi:hypothetical protein